MVGCILLAVISVAVASLAAAAFPVTFALAFLVDFFEEVLLIKDFFVTAIVVFPQILDWNCCTHPYIAGDVPNSSRETEFLEISCFVQIRGD